MSQPKAVIFDIGNVLIEWNPERYFDGVMPVEDRKRMFETVDLHDVNDGIDRGGPFRDTIYAAAERHSEFGTHIKMWHDNWLDIAAPAIPHSVNLLRALRKNGVPTLALSNFGIETFEIAEREYPFLKEFDQRFISGHMGVVKPHHPIYEMVEAQCGFAPNELLFADDRPDNIATAAARGWHTHLFENAQGWADALVAHGFLCADEASS